MHESHTLIEALIKCRAQRTSVPDSRNRQQPWHISKWKYARERTLQTSWPRLQLLLASSRDPNTKFICLFKFLPTFVKLIQSFQIFNQRSCHTQVSPLHILTSENYNQIQNNIVISPYSRERFSSFSIVFIYLGFYPPHPPPPSLLLSLSFFVFFCFLLLLVSVSLLWLVFWCIYLLLSFTVFGMAVCLIALTFLFVIYQVVCVNWNSW